MQRVVGIEEGIFCSKRHFAQQHDADVICLAREAVVGALAAHVSEVDTLAKHVAGAGRFGRGNSEPLTENADPVCEARTMPEELTVSNRLPNVWQVLADRKRIENLKRVVVVRCGVRVVHISTSCQNY